MIKDPVLGEIADEIYRKDSQRLRITMKRNWSKRLREIEAEEDAKFEAERQRMDARFYSIGKLVVKPVAQPFMQPVRELEYVG